MKTTGHRPTWSGWHTLLGAVFGCCLIGALVVAASTFSRDRNARSRGDLVTFEPSSFDFGEVLQTKIIRHKFSLTNRTTEPVRIVGVRTTCSCAVVKEEILGQIIPVGGSVLVPMEYHSAGKDGQVSGSLAVYLQRESAKSRNIEYEAEALIRGTVLAYFDVEPSTLDFGSVRPGAQAARTVTFRPKNLERLKISEPHTTSSAFNAFVVERGNTSLGSPQATVVFRAPLAARRQVYSDIIEFRTSCPKVPVATIYVRGQVSPEIEVSPDVLVLGEHVSAGESRIEVHTHNASKVTRVTKSTPSGVSEVPYNTDKGSVAGQWGMSHRIGVANVDLESAQKMDFELEIRNGAGLIEARSASVEIKCLSLAKDTK